MTRRDQEMTLQDIGDELVRLGNLLKSIAVPKPEDPPPAETPSSKVKQGRKSRRTPPLQDSMDQLAQELVLVGRDGAEQRLTQMSVKELQALGSGVGARLDSKANKGDLVKRLLWFLFDAERGGELLRTLYQRGEEREEKAVFDTDHKWFAQYKDQLLAQYRGRFIALLDGQVIDSDPDFGALAERVYGKYGYRDLLMPWVGEETGPVRIPAPRTKGLSG